jgi:hypothetical protein
MLAYVPSVCLRPLWLCIRCGFAAPKKKSKGTSPGAIAGIIIAILVAVGAAIGA